MDWTNDRVLLRDLKPWDQNPRQITKRAAKRLLGSWKDYGQVQMIVVGPDNEVYDGHQRLSALLAVYGENYEVEVRRASRALTDDERKRLVVLLHAGAMGQWNWDILSAWDTPTLKDWGLDEETLAAYKKDVAALAEMMKAEDQDQEPRVDEIPERWAILIECANEQEQLELLGKLAGQGIQCRALVS